MYKILVIINDILQCKKIVNYISQFGDKYKLYYMAYKGKECVNMILKKKIDIILIDDNLPDLTINEVLRFLEDNDLKCYKNKILIISTKENDKIINDKNKYVYGYIHQPYTYNDLYSNLNMMTKYDLKKDKIYIKNIIHNQLIKINYNYSLLGTKYLEECILEIYRKNLKDKKYILQTDLFPNIAYKYNTTIHNIKCSINRATEDMYFNCPIELLKKFLGYNIQEKPKLKLIIYTIINNIDN